MRRWAVTFGVLLFSAVTAMSQSLPSVGYVIVTPSSPNAAGFVAFEDLVTTRAGDIFDVGVMPPDLTTNVLMPVDFSRLFSETLGVAMVNPNNGTVNIMMTLLRSDGTPVALTNFTIPPHRQISRLVTEFFAVVVPSEFSGNLSVISSSPISVLGLKLTGQNSSTIPLINVSQLTFPLPLISLGVGGLGADLFPQFVVGGVWLTEIMILNSSPSTLTVRVDVFAQDGTPLVVTLNGRTASSFTNLVVPGNGRLVLAP